MPETLINFPNSMTFPIPKETEGTVAIITRTKDRPILLSRTLSTVLAQKFKDWHHFIVNDGGRVETLQETVAPYLSAFGDKLTILNNPVTRGMEAASNVALKMILAINEGARFNEVPSTLRFGYVIVLDDDDSWNPEFLNETVGFLEKSENARYCGVATQALTVYEKIQGEEVHYVRQVAHLPDVKFITIADALKNNPIVPAASLFRAELFLRVGMFNEELPVLGDWDFAIRALCCADIGYISRHLVYYHHRTEGQNDYSNSVQGRNLELHHKTRASYESAILRDFIRGGKNQLGTILMMNIITKRMEDRMQDVAKRVIAQTDLLHFKLDALKRETLGLHFKLDRMQKLFLFKEFLFERFTKHLLRLFNFPKPPADQSKNFLKRFDSFFYQVFIKNFINLFKK